MLIIFVQSRQVNAMIRIRKFIDVNERFTIYKSFVLSKVNFRLLWHACVNTAPKSLEKVQKRALRFVFDDFTSAFMMLY